MDENRLGELILGCALKVHKSLGPGLLENAYETCLAHELAKQGLAAKRQWVMPLVYDDLTIDAGYRLDLLVGDCVVVEVKAVERLMDVHRAQLLSYLKLGRFRLGYLLNFNVPLERRHHPPREQSLTSLRSPRLLSALCGKETSAPRGSPLLLPDHSRRPGPVAA